MICVRSVSSVVFVDADIGLLEIDNSINITYNSEIMEQRHVISLMSNQRLQFECLT